jgi:hypothetical protein
MIVTVNLREKEQHIKFFITNLRKDQMILGHPWLCTFNPQIDWTQGNLQGKLEIATTAAKRQIAQAHVLLARQLTADPQKRHCATIMTPSELEKHVRLITQ